MTGKSIRTLTLLLLIYQSGCQFSKETKKEPAAPPVSQSKEISIYDLAQSNNEIAFEQELSKIPDAAINEPNGEGRTLLEIAVRNSKEAYVRALLKRGALPMRKFSGGSGNAIEESGGRGRILELLRGMVQQQEASVKKLIFDGQFSEALEKYDSFLLESPELEQFMLEVTISTIERNSVLEKNRTGPFLRDLLARKSMLKDVNGLLFLRASEIFPNLLPEIYSQRAERIASTGKGELANWLISIPAERLKLHIEKLKSIGVAPTTTSIYEELTKRTETSIRERDFDRLWQLLKSAKILNIKLATSGNRIKAKFLISLYENGDTNPIDTGLLGDRLQLVTQTISDEAACYECFEYILKSNKHRNQVDDVLRLLLIHTSSFSESFLSNLSSLLSITELESVLNVGSSSLWTNQKHLAKTLFEKSASEQEYKSAQRLLKKFHLLSLLQEPAALETLLNKRWQGNAGAIAYSQEFMEEFSTPNVDPLSVRAYLKSEVDFLLARQSLTKSLVRKINALTTEPARHVTVEIRIDGQNAKADVSLSYYSALAIVTHKKSPNSRPLKDEINELFMDARPTISSEQSGERTSISREQLMLAYIQKNKTVLTKFAPFIPDSPITPDDFFDLGFAGDKKAGADWLVSNGALALLLRKDSTDFELQVLDATLAAASPRFDFEPKGELKQMAERAHAATGATWEHEERRLRRLLIVTNPRLTLTRTRDLPVVYVSTIVNGAGDILCDGPRPVAGPLETVYGQTIQMTDADRRYVENLCDMISHPKGDDASAKLAKATKREFQLEWFNVLRGMCGQNLQGMAGIIQPMISQLNVLENQLYPIQRLPQIIKPRLPR